MKLKEYCERLGCSYTKIARLWGIHYSTLYYVAQGYACTYENMEKIIKGSGGLITFEDLKPLYKAHTKNRKASDKQLENQADLIAQ